jgi:hypothetical protein
LHLKQVNSNQLFSVVFPMGYIERVPKPDSARAGMA